MRFVEHVMGMPASVEVPDRAAADAVFDWLREVDRRFSPFRPDSEVCTGRHSRELTEILDLCAEYENRTGGAFRVQLPGRPLDPCGVVKGWATQRAADLLRAAGVTEFCLNVGGDVVTGGRPWRVGIQHPTWQTNKRSRRPSPRPENAACDSRSPRHPSRSTVTRPACAGW